MLTSFLLDIFPAKEISHNAKVKKTSSEPSRIPERRCGRRCGFGGKTFDRAA